MELEKRLTHEAAENKDLTTEIFHLKHAAETVRQSFLQQSNKVSDLLNNLEICKELVNRQNDMIARATEKINYNNEQNDKLVDGIRYAEQVVAAYRNKIAKCWC